MSRGENQQSPMAILHGVSKPAFEFTNVMQFSAKYVSCFFCCVCMFFVELCSSNLSGHSLRPFRPAPRETKYCGDMNHDLIKLLTSLLKNLVGLPCLASPTYNQA